MAALILRFGQAGSLKCLQRESWVALQRIPTAALATDVQEPKKPGKKAKAAKGPDEQASQLASKTVVAFPSKVVLPAVLSLQALESSSPGEGPTVKAVSAVGSAARQANVLSTSPAPVNTEIVTSKSSQLSEEEPIISVGDSESGIVRESTDTTIMESVTEAPPNETGISTNSSSSSDSDSDSDSDDDEKREGKATPWADTTVTKESDGDVSVACDAVSDGKAHRPGSAQSTPSTATGDVLPDIAPEASSTTHGVISKAPSEETSTIHLSSINVAEEKSTESGVEEASVLAAKALPFNTFERKPGTTADASSKQTVAMGTHKPGDPVPVVATSEDPSVTAAPGTASSENLVDPAPVLADTASSEWLVDPAPVMSESAGRKLKPEAQAEVSKSPDEAAPPPLEPEPEPFDNSTYKNLQHHSYNTYTFTDMEVEMKKYRQPQPSSGRPSPHH